MSLVFIIFILKTLITLKFSYSDCKVEVVTCLKRQNALISSCHEGLSVSVESVASSGHLGNTNSTCLILHVV